MLVRKVLPAVQEAQESTKTPGQERTTEKNGQQAERGRGTKSKKIGESVGDVSALKFRLLSRIERWQIILASQFIPPHRTQCPDIVTAYKTISESKNNDS